TIDNISNWAYSVLDHVTGPAQAGTQAKNLAKQADEWLARNAVGKPVEDYWGKFIGWMRGSAANQRALAVQDDKRRQIAQQAAPIAGTAGALVGGTAAGLLEQLPIMSMIGGESQTAALLATFAEGGSRYSEAIQAGHDSAWLEGLEGAATAPMFRYMLNSPAGRLKSGFMNWAMQAGEPEFEKFLRGEKTDFTEFAWNSSVAFLLGQGLGHEMEKAGARTPEEFAAPFWEKYGTLEGQAPAPAGEDPLQGFSGELIKPSPLALRHKPLVEGPAPEAEETPRETRFTARLSPAAEEFFKAQEALRNGDTNKAADHVDRGMALEPPKDRQEIGKNVIKGVKSQLKKGNLNDIVNEQFYGLSGQKRNPGESGAWLNPAQLIEEFFSNAWQGISKKTKYIKENWPEDLDFNAVFAPHKISEAAPIGDAKAAKYNSWARQYQGQLQAGIVRAEPPPEGVDIRSEWTKNVTDPLFGKFVEPKEKGNWAERMLYIDNVLRGTDKVERRRAEFSKYSQAELKQFKLLHEKGKSTGNATIDWLMHLHDAGYAGMEIGEKDHDIEFQHRDWYIYHWLNQKGQEAFKRWYGKKIEADPNFTKKRELGTWEEVYKAGIKPYSENPEDIFQARLQQSANALKKIRTLRELADADQAFLKSTPDGRNFEKDLPEEIQQWPERRSPNGEWYRIEPGVEAVLDNAWDSRSFYTVPFVGPLVRLASMAKGISAPLILGLSAAHAKHVEGISWNHVFTQLQRATLSGKLIPLLRQQGKANILDNLMVLALKTTGLSGDTLLDYFHLKR